MLWEELESLRLGTYEKKKPPVENRDVAGLSVKDFLCVFTPVDKWLNATFSVNDDFKFLIAAAGWGKEYRYSLFIKNADGSYETLGTYYSMEKLLEKGEVNGQMIKELLPKIIKVSKFPLIPCG